MQLWRASVVCAGLMLGGCVTTSSSTPAGFAPPTDYVPLDQVQIVNRFDVISVNASNLGVEAQRCVPTLAAGSKSVADTAGRLPLPTTTVISMSHLSSSSSLVVSGARAVCIRQSAAQYPIFAAEAFGGTVNPSGVPPTVTDGWYAQIARRVAETGRVTVAYVFSNGNADVASYWVEAPNKNVIRYANEFKKAGSWETGAYDFRFSHASMSGVSATKRGGSSMMKADLLGTR